MINFKQFLEKLENAETIAVFPGGFKPPTNGHFQALESILQNADKGVVLIGNNPRDGIGQEMAYQIWNIYVPYLSKPVRVERSVSPVTSAYNLVKENTNINFIVGVGPESGKRDTRYDSFRRNPDKYPNVSIVDIPLSGEGVRGTKVREMIAMKDPTVVDYFVPPQIRETDKERIKSILGIA
jgi:nicotinamide mononucleotide adenylyltransferase